MVGYSNNNPSGPSAPMGSRSNPLASPTAGLHSRFPINVDATLNAFDYKFQNGDIFRSASQICDMFLYPNEPAYTALILQLVWAALMASAQSAQPGTSPNGGISTAGSPPTMAGKRPITPSTRGSPPSRTPIPSTGRSRPCAKSPITAPRRTHGPRAPTACSPSFGVPP